jgi:hypothetical protein
LLHDIVRAAVSMRRNVEAKRASYRPYLVCLFRCRGITGIEDDASRRN